MRSAFTPVGPAHSLLCSTLLFAVAAPALPGAALDLVPMPKCVREVSGTLTIAPRTCSLSGARDPRSEYALETLGACLGEGAVETDPGTVLLRVAASLGELAAAASALGLDAPPADRWREAFVLDVGITDPERIVIVGAPSGLIYGVFALSHLLATGQEPATLPRLALSDWPSFLTRGYTGCPRDVSPASLQTLDWLARWRINACYYEIYGDQGQDGAPPEVADIQRECARRGITLYGLISNWRTERLLRRELCPSNLEDLARIRRYATELLDRGCEGLIFLFDDITQAAVEHVERCEKCKGNFAGLADGQLALMRPMLEVAQARGIERLIVCPTHYYHGWQSSYGGKLDGVHYYAAWHDVPQMAGVQVYHCLLREQDLREVQQAGLRNFIYWYNGGYTYESQAPGAQIPAGMWGGFTQLAYGWYCARWDSARGPVPNEDTYEAFRKLPRLTQHAWICGGGDYPWALWGTYCWDAERHEPTETERRLVATLFGPDAEPHYARWRDVTRKWLPRLLAPPNVTSPGHRSALIRELQQDAVDAREAAQAFGGAASDLRCGVATTALRTDTTRRMTESAEALLATSARAAEGKGTVTIGEQAEERLEQGVRRERRIEISDFWSRYVLRYSQTQEPDGTLHRSQWHFGSGLGMAAPSYRNWYDAGFMDVLLDGQSLDAFTPTFTAVPGPAGEDLRATWNTAAGTLEIRFSLFAGGLRMEGKLQADRQVPLAVRLFAIPGAGWGTWQDMDKYVVTEGGETPHGAPLTLAPGQDWLFLADRTYDIPHQEAEGPCAVLFGPPIPTIRCDNGTYVVQIDADYPAGTRAFDLVVWDFHGQRNAEALNSWRQRLSALREALAAPK